MPRICDKLCVNNNNFLATPSPLRGKHVLVAFLVVYIPPGLTAHQWSTHQMRSNLCLAGSRKALLELRESRSGNRSVAERKSVASFA